MPILPSNNSTEWIFLVFSQWSMALGAALSRFAASSEVIISCTALHAAHHSRTTSRCRLTLTDS